MRMSTVFLHGASGDLLNYSTILFLPHASVLYPYIQHFHTAGKQKPDNKIEHLIFKQFKGSRF